MRSVCSRRSESSTAWRIQRRDSPERPGSPVAPPPIGLPTLVAISTWSRLPLRASQRPITDSLSPPVWPGTQVE